MLLLAKEIDAPVAYNFTGPLTSGRGKVVTLLATVPQAESSSKIAAKQPNSLSASVEILNCRVQ